MRMEVEYCVTAETHDAAERLAALWGEQADGNSFEGFENDIFSVMEHVIRAAHQMEEGGQKDSFQIAGKCDTDYDCTLFMIEYSGGEPRIKAEYAEQEDEEKYYAFQDSVYEEIPDVLMGEEYKTFKKAIADDMPLGGFLAEPYDEWVASIIG